jgi:hypothetical protein
LSTYFSSSFALNQEGLWYKVARTSLSKKSRSCSVRPSLETSSKSMLPIREFSSPLLTPMIFRSRNGDSNHDASVSQRSR